MNKHTLNLEHPAWVELQDSHTKVQEQSELSEALQEMVRNDIESYDYAFDFDGVVFHTFRSSISPYDWLVYELANGTFLACVAGMMGYELEEFSTLGEALAQTFADWITEGDIGEFNENGNAFVVNGLPLVRV